MRAVIYTRVSSKDQVDNLSLATQEERCVDFCRRSGWDVAGVFVEEGESAKSADRTQLTRLLDFCRSQKGKVDVVVVYALSRFSRSTHDHHVLRALLNEFGINLRSATEPIDDTPTGKFMETMLSAVAQLDNDVKSERTVVGMKAAADRGRWVFMAPVGYLKGKTTEGLTLVPDPERAPLVRRAFEMAASGAYTKAEILQTLTVLGLRTRKGKNVRSETLSRVLGNPLYMGVDGSPALGNEPPRQLRASR